MAERPLGLVLLSDAPDRVHFALGLAATAAALDRQVVVFASAAGVRALLADAPEAPPADGVATLAQLWDAIAELPIALMACEAAMRMHGVRAASLRPAVKVCGIATFLQAVSGGELISV